MRIDRKLKTTFDKVSRLYELVRVGYPEKLVDDIIKFSQLPKGSKLLDIGCGSGKATILLAERDFEITGIDIGKNLIGIAKLKSKKLKNIKFILGSFENTEFPNNYFDIIISAQAWHWIDPSQGYRKIHRLLKHGGSLAFFWYFPLSGESHVLKKLGEVFDKYNPHRRKTGYTSRLIPFSIEVREKLISSGLFKNVNRRVYYKQGIVTAKRFIEIALTYGWIQSLQKEKRERLINELSEILRGQKPFSMPYKYILLQAKKKD